MSLSESSVPYLSVVTVSRNDGHGGNPLRRTQLFVNSLSWQAERFALTTELVLVEWNPPEDSPSLSEVLNFPAHRWFSARVIVVPRELHQAFRYADRMWLFQMIGKNVGIRRARGEFVLCTNIDILLDDSLFAALASRDLDPKRLYRAARYDIDVTVPDEDHQAQQLFCRDPANHIRRNQRNEPEEFKQLIEKEPTAASVLLREENKAKFPWAVFSEAGAIPTMELKENAPLPYLFTSGCGDFTLLHKDAWADIRGYAEYESYSMHIDSIGCAAAHYAGYREISFLPPLVCYHIEHGQQGDSVPWNTSLEATANFYRQYIDRRIPIFDATVIWYTVMETVRTDPSARLNAGHWGLAGVTLEEYAISPEGTHRITANCPEKKDYKPLAAIKDRFDSSVLFQTTYYRFRTDLEKVALYEAAKTVNRGPFSRIVFKALVGYVRWVRRLLRYLTEKNRITP